MKPTRLFHAAGILTDPPVSEPTPAEDKLKAVATAAPEEDPPGAKSLDFILGGVAVFGLTPRPENASSV